jgi:exopolyphosphatase/guanosine-5'-triphosphate,3'-diphosphate pyrophosphatase
LKAKERVVSIIDIGSNTIKFLVAKGPGVTVLDEVSVDTRIGTGMGRGDRIVLQKGAMDASVACVKRLLERAAAFSPAETVVVATSAVRDAENGGEFSAQLKATTGLSVRILSGDEEARLVGCGVAQDPAIDPRRSFYLMDLGGGSLELLEFCGGKVRQKVSLPLGAVRLNEKLVKNPALPLGEDGIAEVSEYVTESVAASGFSFGIPGALVGTGGSLAHARFILGHACGKAPSESDPVIGSAELRALTKKVAAMTLAERCTLPHLPAARADIMPVSLVVIATIMGLSTSGTIVHSFYNLRFGLAAEMLASRCRIC